MMLSSRAGGAQHENWQINDDAGAGDGRMDLSQQGVFPSEIQRAKETNYKLDCMQGAGAMTRRPATQNEQDACKNAYATNILVWCCERSSCYGGGRASILTTALTPLTPVFFHTICKYLVPHYFQVHFESGECLRTSLKIGLNNILLAQRNKEPHQGCAYRENRKA